MKDLTIKLFVLIIFLISWLFLSFRNPFITKDDFRKLGFLGRGAMSGPEMQVEIDNNKSFRFHGIRSTNITGYYIGVLSDSIYKELIDKLKLIDNEGKQPKINVPDDWGECHIRIILSDGKELKHDMLEIPKEEPLQEFLLDLYKKVKLTKVDTLVFTIANFE